MNYEDYRNDVLAAAEEYISYEGMHYDNWDYLFDEILNNDGVTGNASGSYTFCAYTAEQNVKDAIFDDEIKSMFNFADLDMFEILRNRGAETLDVIIRYLIAEELYTTLEEFYHNLYDSDEDEE